MPRRSLDTDPGLGVISTPALPQPSVDPLSFPALPDAGGGVCGVNMSCANDNAQKGIIDNLRDKNLSEAERILQDSFGDARSEREGAKTFYDPDTKISYNLHSDPKHGDPHIDVRQRGEGDIDRIPLGSD